MFRAAIITASDKGAKGQREDVSGSVIREILEQNGYEVVYQVILPDERQLLAEEMERICVQQQADLILTTGWHWGFRRGIGPQRLLWTDRTASAGDSRRRCGETVYITKRAMLSRAVAGIREKTLIINLPGSPKAVRENLEYVITELAHGLEILRGEATECARS